MLKESKMRRKNPLNCLALALLAFTCLMLPVSQAQMKKSANILAFSGKSDARLKESFAIFDVDKDGKVSRIEFRLQTGDMFFVRDKNKDSHLTPDEIPNAGPKVFAAADTNSDGKLTPHEFGEAKFMKFEAYDLNKDGSITLEEVRAAVKNNRR